MNKPLERLVLRSGVAYGQRVSHRDTQASFFNWRTLSSEDTDAQHLQAGEKQFAWELQFWKRVFWATSVVMIMLLIAGFSISEHKTVITASIVPLLFLALFSAYKVFELENQSAFIRQLAAMAKVPCGTQLVQDTPQDSVQLAPVYEKCNLLQNVSHDGKYEQSKEASARYQFCGYRATYSPVLRAVEDVYSAAVADVAYVGRPRNLWLGIVDYPEAIEAVAAFYRHFAMCEQEADAAQITIAMDSLPIDSLQAFDVICEGVVEQIITAWRRTEGCVELGEIGQSCHHYTPKEEMVLAATPETTAIRKVRRKLLAKIDTYVPPVKP